MNEAELLKDLAATFPGLNARPLTDFLKSAAGASEGAVFREQVCMPDGEPIYLLPSECGHVDPDGYSCLVHDGFLAWLDARGWYVETFDYGTYMIVAANEQGAVCAT